MEKHKQEEKMRYQTAVKQHVEMDNYWIVMQRIIALNRNILHIFVYNINTWVAEDITEYRKACSLIYRQVYVWVSCTCSVLTILVHGVRLRLLLANISKGAYNRDAVGQFFLVLVMVLFEKSLTDLSPGIFTYRARCLILIQNHV